MMRLNETLQQLGSPVAYYPQIAHFLGDVKTAIFLCQFAYWKGKERGEETGIYKTRESLYEETGLSRREQETARRNLKKKGYLTEKYIGLPRKLFFFLNWDKITEDWENFHKKSQENQHNARNVPARGYETYQQVGTKVSGKEAGNVPAITENTTKNTTENTKTTSLSEKEGVSSPSCTEGLSQDILNSGEKKDVTIPGDEAERPSNTDTSKDVPSAGGRDCSQLTISPQEIVESWNSICGLELSKVIKLTKQRKEKISSRIEEYGGAPVFWERLFRRIVQTPFLLGNNDRGWRADIDFVFGNDTNISKILEGKYERKQKIKSVNSGGGSEKREEEQEQLRDERERQEEMLKRFESLSQDEQNRYLLQVREELGRGVDVVPPALIKVRAAMLASPQVP